MSTVWNDNYETGREDDQSKQSIDTNKSGSVGDWWNGVAQDQ